jgi:hypothetical protein
MNPMERESLALSLTRFLAGFVGAILVQAPAAALADLSSEASPLVLAGLLGAVLTGFLWLSPPPRTWGAPLAYICLAGMVGVLLAWRGQALPRNLPMLGVLFGGWSLLATAFVIAGLRGRRKAEADAFREARREKKNPPAAWGRRGAS